MRDDFARTALRVEALTLATFLLEREAGRAETLAVLLAEAFLDKADLELDLGSFFADLVFAAETFTVDDFADDFCEAAAAKASRGPVKHNANNKNIKAKEGASLSDHGARQQNAG